MRRTPALFMTRDHRRRIAILAAGATLAAIAAVALLLSFPGQGHAGGRMLDVSPPTGLASASVTVTGSGDWIQDINPPYEIYWDGKGGDVLGTFDPDADGDWEETVDIPEDATEGAHEIVACEGAGGDFQACASDGFTVLPPPVPRTLDLDPSSALPDTTVTVTGSGDWLSANPPFEIFWDMKGGDSLGDFSPGGDGSWEEDVTVPADASPGPHEIVACEGYGGDFQLCVSANFSVSAPDRTLDVDPDSGLPGASITASGENWLYSVNPPYRIFWDEKGGDELDDFVVAVDGSWDETVAVPNDADPGDHQIVACEGYDTDFQLCLSADFTVLGEATDTPGPDDTPTPTPEPGDLIGDVDCNGTINAIDAAFILQYAAALLADLPCPENADVNTDGNVTSVDAALILQYSAGLLTSLPP